MFIRSAHLFLLSGSIYLILLSAISGMPIQRRAALIFLLVLRQTANLWGFVPEALQ